MHTLIVGQSQSGKSALAKKLGSRLRLAGEEVVAFNPTGEDGYTRRDQFGCAAAEWETWDADDFGAEVDRRVRADLHRRWLIIDEAHELLKPWSDHVWLGTRGRHFGLNVIAITQAAQKLDTTFRGQCARLYLFRCSLTDARYLADQYGEPELIGVLQFPPGRFAKVEAGRLTVGTVFVTVPEHSPAGVSLEQQEDAPCPSALSSPT